MDTDSILTFQAPGREGVRLSCQAAPVMELAYAVHYLLWRVEEGDTREHDVTWLAPLLAERRELVAALRSFGERHDAPELSPAILVLAARYGYDRDEDPARFLQDLPTLPQRYLDDGWGGPGEEPAGPEAKSETALRSTVERLRAGPVVAELRELLTSLWEAVGPTWQREGRVAVAGAVERFREAFERTGSVLEALPPHHFTRFEHLAHGIRDAEARGRVVVIPLFLASAGGFNFLIDDTQYIGFGLQSETVFERTAQRVAGLAQRAKALGDPTRLMALALVGRFSSMRMTVGDLADQIGVSQPTLSGHLKLLREAGLVDVERHGNKSFYTLEREGVRQLLDDVARTLLD